MNYIMFCLLLGLVLGVMAVASNPSPYFAALGLVMVAGMACGVMTSQGGLFLALILFLIYLGGMLVVFAYSAALAAELYPESWMSWPVAGLVMLYLSVLVYVLGGVYGWWYEVAPSTVEEYCDFSVLRGDVGGVALMYSGGGGMLILGGWVLLLTLFVVLELTRGLSRGVLRAV
uniref:NADH-ubiquinone oxidoreductase chain 6 n=1 Tax=Congrogadus subducens TaxID=1206929 RepID=A0A8F6D526_9TELE|nr:NADH dehydrogenase subunit 6 [Congrogadus subducens]QXP99626.1 NADH dehydrogenase subunit 6 [Congrogadus subducens]